MSLKAFSWYTRYHGNKTSPFINDTKCKWSLVILYIDLLFCVCCWAPGLYLCEYVCDISISFYERNLLLHKVTTIFTISYKCGEFDLICVKLRSCKSSYELFLNANKTARSLNRNYNENSNMKNVIRMYLNERSIY